MTASARGKENGIQLPKSSPSQLADGRKIIVRPDALLIDRHHLLVSVHLPTPYLTGARSSARELHYRRQGEI